MPEWEPVIGLEIHVQLKTRTKMFCRCENTFGGEPNTRTCPVCLAHPGALPVPNERAIEWTIKLGLALGCTIAERAVFHRKNYFYPDNPKGYQISQYDEPLCIDGAMLVPGPDGDAEVGIIRAHLEEDAAKTIHVGGATGRIVGAAHSNVDFNRGGTPLVEIVTQPDIRSAEEAKRFLQLLRQTIVELGISDAEMEKGTLRADANVSVRERGETGFRTRTELKNMNSFNHIARGIDAEIRRQIEVWESGGEVVQQTLDYEVKSDTVTARRRKEEADDYRYFPEPDLVPLEPSRGLVERLREELPELPGERIRSLGNEIGFDSALELVATGNEATARGLVEHGLDWPKAASVAMNELAGREPLRENFRALVAIIQQRDRITREAYHASFASSVTTAINSDEVLAQTVVADTAELEPLVDRILEASPAQVASYRGGKQGVLGFFVGQVMKETQGKADPKIVNELLRQKLDA
ncbi:MAG: Asp-tRNA(Asn)/Glu-tRNA(Gln) amidotransferase subunit GatB [Actinobacteria bacterium]|nr:MAG: Asp-tRNA(Asn)/Glu-tRNA(Gln) amidotransferase subunit GatB [Actinomycetota bacterium]